MMNEEEEEEEVDGGRPFPSPMPSPSRPLFFSALDASTKLHPAWESWAKTWVLLRGAGSCGSVIV